MANFSSCSSAFMYENALQLFVMFIISVVFLLAMSAVKRRRRFRSDLCHGRPGPVVPLNMLDDFRNRYGYALAFGVLATHCLQALIDKEVSVFGKKIGSYLKSSPSYVRVFIKPMVAVYIGVVAYPIFYCLRTKHRRLGNVSGAIYCCIWLTFSISKYVNYKGCMAEDSSKSQSKIADVIVSMELPHFICLALLVFKFVADLFKDIRRRYLGTPDEFKENYMYAYTANLLFKNRSKKSSSRLLWIMKYLHKIYKPDPDFRYSCQIISSFVVSAVAVYAATVLLYSMPEHAIGLGLKHWLVYLAITFAALQSCVICFQVFALYREHVMKLRRGDRSWILVPPNRQSPVTFMSASMKYAGFQIGYLVAGFLVNFSLALTVAGIIQLSITWHKKFPQLLEGYWPYAFFVFSAFLGQYLAARFIFLQDKGDQLAIDNRKAYHITAYFMFFYNIFIGLISSFLRLLKLIILGTLFLTRIQKPIFAADLIRFDTGYLAYIGYVLVEHYHSNPILNVFVNLINPKKDSESKVVDLRQFTILEEEPESGNSFPKSAASKLARNRWHLAVMLMRNPSLRRYRKQHDYNHEGELINKHDEELLQDIV